MKKWLIAIGVAILCTALVLAWKPWTKFAKNEVEPSIDPDMAGETQDTDIDTVDYSEASEENGEETEPVGFEVDAKDCWEGYGFAEFTCVVSGTYELVAKGDEDIEWKVFVLDEPFDDALRYLPQANEAALVGEGEVEIAEGQEIYIQCSYNSYTGIEAADGDGCSLLLVNAE